MRFDFIIQSNLKAHPVPNLLRLQSLPLAHFTHLPVVVVGQSDVSALGHGEAVALH